ncbi:MAG: DUF2971 domain-containing protein [Clostridia bacterium]|nr:DUF2971 domain-containing protein [Clostridia bacterium]
MNANLVYYYCNVSTALAVLREKEIWMTDIRNLNDLNELTGVYNMFFNLLEEHDQDNKNALSALLEIARQPGAIQLYERPSGAHPYYVACFSKNQDSVSQWVSFADDGHGVAIGFDESCLMEAAQADGLEYHAISYVREDDIKQHIPEIYEYLLNGGFATGRAMMDATMARIKEIYESGAYYKTHHYRSENEKRIIYEYPHIVKNLPEGWEVKGIKAYAKKNMINTCVPLAFPPSAIKAIITGPKYQKNYYELEMALEVLGYKVSDINIQESTSGYR